MMKRTSSGLFALAVMWAGAAVLGGSLRPAPRPGHGQEDRPKFYVARVVSSDNVKNPNGVLGEPDGRYAELAPGGRMVLLMEKPIVSSSGFDDGLIVSKGGTQYGLEGCFIADVTNEIPQRAWMPLAAGMSTGGFRLTSMDMGRTPEGSPGVNIIRIANDGKETLLLDAVVGYGR
jgi:hypothetical protein